MITNVNMMIL